MTQMRANVTLMRRTREYISLQAADDVTLCRDLLIYAEQNMYCIQLCIILIIYKHLITSDLYVWWLNG